MKKSPHLIVALLLLVGIVISCKKSENPQPAATVHITKPSNPGTDNPMCDNTICKVPFRILSTFIPSGFYDGGDQGIELLIDEIDEPVTYAGEAIRIRYTKGTQWGWGAHFLNNDNWAGEFQITPDATKITFYVKVDYSANVTFNAFANVQYGKVELYKLSAPVAPEWQKITIPLLGKPSTFAAPLNIVIDGVDTPGQIVTVDIKDLLIE
jgi:hypothetical protein